MPQLNPTPWFITSSFSWMVFLVVLPPKVLAYIFPHKPTPKLAKETKTHNWNWPWQ